MPRYESFFSSCTTAGGSPSCKPNLAYNRKLPRKITHDLKHKLPIGSARGLNSLVVAVLFCGAFVQCSQAQEHQLSPEKRTQIEAAVSKFMASTHVPRVSVGVVENGEYEWGSGAEEMRPVQAPVKPLYFAIPLCERH
jgi:hypothetical protein